VIRSLSTPIKGRQNNKIKVKSSVYWDFTSNDYLNLSSHPELLKSIPKTLSQGFGSTGSRLLSGDYDVFHQLESNLASTFSKESALLFNSGYQANCGILPALTTDKDLIIADKLSHASIIDGLRLSQATFTRFRHNTFHHLKALLTEHREKYEQCYIVTESLFSMDGDSPNFDQLIELKKEFSCKLYVDVAHSFGCSGKSGCGLDESVLPHIDFIIGTFGKALGSYGAFIACDDHSKQVLINQARSFMYSTALPLPIIYWNNEALSLLPSLTKERAQLAAKARFFRSHINQLGYDSPSTYQIVPVILGSSSRSEKIADQLAELGYWVKPIRYPTVPHHQARLRFSITTGLPDDVLQSLVSVFKSYA